MSAVRSWQAFEGRHAEAMLWRALETSDSVEIDCATELAAKTIRRYLERRDWVVAQRGRRLRIDFCEPDSAVGADS